MNSQYFECFDADCNCEPKRSIRGHFGALISKVQSLIFTSQYQNDACHDVGKRSFIEIAGEGDDGIRMNVTEG